MKLIERYIDEVGKHLPNKNRSDIQAEIRSTLEDMLEDRAQASGQPANDNLVKDVLKSYGPPQKVAASYLPERYLIGPKLFPIFTLVLKIVLSVLTGLALAGFGVRYGTSALTTEAFLTTLGKTLLDYLGGIITAFGNIVFIFAILQWTLPASEFEDEKDEKGWDPAMLEEEPEPDEVRMWTPIWEIVITAAGLLVLNFYPQVIAIWSLEAGKWTSIVLTDAFFHYLPLIDALLVLQIGHNMILLRQGRWTTLTRWLEAGLTLLSMILAYTLLSGPALVNLSVETLSGVFHDAEAASSLSKIFNLIPTLVLLLIILLEGIDLVKNIIKLIFKHKKSLPLLGK